MCKIVDMKTAQNVILTVYDLLCDLRKRELGQFCEDIDLTYDI
jgi:hypothetical protein